MAIHMKNIVESCLLFIDLFSRQFHKKSGSRKLGPWSAESTNQPDRECG